MNNLSIFLALLIFCFIVTSVAIVPFINLLYALRFQRKKQDDTTDAFGEKTPVFNQFHQIKEGTPIGGGLLIVIVVSVLFALILPIMQLLGIHVTSVYSNHQAEVNVIFFTFLSFSILGLYDDIKKFFGFERSGFFGLRMKFKLVIQVLLAVIIALMLHFQLGISFLYVPFFGTFSLGFFYVPIAVFVIVAFANAVNITDGLDGLASGILMISLFGLWLLSTSILDIPLSVFLALWIGSLISFLYFNVYPARIMLGDVGALSFGATLAVVGLLLGKVPALLIMGFIFVAEVSSSLIQLSSKKILNKKVFKAAPFHLTLQSLGWHESKIVQRAWLLQIMLTIFGVWLAVI